MTVILTAEQDITKRTLAYLKRVGRPVTPEEIAAALGESDWWIAAALRPLTEDGTIFSPRQNHYEVHKIQREPTDIAPIELYMDAT